MNAACSLSTAGAYIAAGSEASDDEGCIDRSWRNCVSRSPLLVARAVGTVAARRRQRRSPDNWIGWGRTPDQNRHSPLTEITPATSSQLGRVFTIDFRAIDPGDPARRAVVPARDRRPALRDDRRRQRLRARRRHGQDHLALEAGQRGRLPNFGIVANRGVAYCDGKLFIATLDMHLVAVDPRDGKQVKRVPIAAAVPGAASNYGYSETSAPICANGHGRDRRGRLGVRRARLRDGVQDRPHAGLAEPVLDDPARADELAQALAHRRRRRRLDAGQTIDATTNTRLLRHRLGDAALLPAAPARPEPAHRLADRGRPEHRADEVVAAADGHEPVGLRHRAAAARLHRQGRRQDAPRRLGGDDGGRLVRLRRRDRARRSTSASR